MSYIALLKDIFMAFKMSIVWILLDNKLVSNCHFFDGNNKKQKFFSYIWVIIAPNLIVTKKSGMSHLIAFDLFFPKSTISKL